MSQTQLGAPDPLMAGDSEQLCGGLSAVAPGMAAPFVCTRARGHVARRVPEHVAHGPYESRLPVAVAAWTDGSALRIAEPGR